MNSQKQTDSRQSSREEKASSKRIVQIRIHIKTEKANKEHKSKHRKSLSRERPAHSDAEERKFEHSSKSIRDNSAGHLGSQGSELKWSSAKASQALAARTALPEIMEYRGLTEWVGKGSKKSIPSKPLKIPFKELIPIKEVSREDRIENLRKIRDEFRELVNTSNNILVRNSESVFRAYVEKGNNGVLVKELLKKRWWWHLEEKPGKANLFWTEWFNSTHTRQMPEIRVDLTPTGEDYNCRSAEMEPKVQSIRMIVDEETFSKIRPRICLRDEHYLRNHHKSFQIRENGLEEMEVRQITALNNTMHNHIDGCLQLHSKKLLFKNFYSYLKKKNWDPFEFIPITYYIQKNGSTIVGEILRHYDEIEAGKASASSHNLWIVKPGENSNRGYGITVHSDRSELQQELLKRLEDGRRSVIVQKYLENCFLVYGRKFDIRCYILITTVNGCLKGYWYNDGYIRTSSEEYNLDDPGNRMIHLTNDAVQKHNQSYGKYEDFNKMSFANFRKYIAKNGFQSQRFDESYNQMKLIAYYLIASTSSKIKRKQYTFELFGLDFMLDDQLKPLLIEANSNPCLETSGVILGKLIPELVDNVLMTAVDPLFPPPNKAKAKEYLSKDYFRSNKFQLIFSEGQADSRQNYASSQQV